LTREKELQPTGKKGNNRVRAKLADLCALSGALLLETGVVGVTLTDTGKVVACRAKNVRSRVASGLGYDIPLTVPPEVAEGGTETCTMRLLVSNLVVLIISFPSCCTDS
jgi:hypothetical protein